MQCRLMSFRVYCHTFRFVCLLKTSKRGFLFEVKANIVSNFRLDFYWRLKLAVKSQDLDFDGQALNGNFLVNKLICWADWLVNLTIEVSPLKAEFDKFHRLSNKVNQIKSILSYIKHLFTIVSAWFKIHVMKPCFTIY